jgi:hypothetical protein
MRRVEVSRFLATRGVWLVVVEMTLVLLGATFNLSYQFVVWQVIWAIGWSMVALSALVYLPWRALLGFSVLMIAAHNAFDGVGSGQLGSFGWIWKILHEGFSVVTIPGWLTAFVIYPLIPWIGVMSAGFCFGRVYDLEPQKRNRLTLGRKLREDHRAGVAIVLFSFEPSCHARVAVALGRLTQDIGVEQPAHNLDRKYSRRRGGRSSIGTGQALSTFNQFSFDAMRRHIKASSSASKSTRKWSPGLAGTAAGTVNRRFESSVTIMVGYSHYDRRCQPGPGTRDCFAQRLRQ